MQVLGACNSRCAEDIRRSASNSLGVGCILKSSVKTIGRLSFVHLKCDNEQMVISEHLLSNDQVTANQQPVLKIFPNYAIYADSDPRIHPNRRNVKTSSTSARFVDFTKLENDLPIDLNKFVPEPVKKKFNKLHPALFPSESPSSSPTPSSSQSPSATASASPTPTTSTSMSPSATPSVSPSASVSKTPRASTSQASTEKEDPSPTPTPSSSPEEVTVESQTYEAATDGSTTDSEIDLEELENSNESGSVTPPAIGDEVTLEDFTMDGDFGDITPSTRQIFGEKVLNRPVVRQTIRYTAIIVLCNGQEVELRVKYKCNGSLLPLLYPVRITTPLVKVKNGGAGVKISFRIFGPYGNSCKAVFKFKIKRRLPKPSPTSSPVALPTPSSQVTVTPSVSATASASLQATVTPSVSATASATASISPDATVSPSPTSSPSQLASPSASPSASAAATTTPSPSVSTTPAESPSQTPSSSAAPSLTSSPSVSAAPSISGAPASPTLPPTWGVDEVDGSDDNSRTCTSSNNGAGINVLVVDTGCTPQNGGLCGSAYDEDDGDCSDPAQHGTHVAGTVGDANYGVAPDVTISCYKALGVDGGGGYLDDLLDAIEFAMEHEVDVVNLSLGGSGISSDTDDMIKEAADLGIYFSISAGNNAVDACNQFPAHTNWQRVFTVQAHGVSNGVREAAYFSNYGSCTNLTAPGMRVLSNVPGGTAYFQGTSMAAPHVAGILARMLSDNQATSVSGIISTSDITAVYPTIPDVVNRAQVPVLGVGCA